MKPTKQSRTTSRKQHELKHQQLRRMAYRFVRDTMPEIWEEMRIEVGLEPKRGLAKARQTKPRKGEKRV